MNDQQVTEQAKDLVIEQAAPQLTEGDLKKLRKLYVTVQHQRAKPCEHRLDLSRQPHHRNCPYCWFHFFSQHKELVEQCHEMFQADNGILMTQLQGAKFTRRFTQFMATLASWKQQEENV